MTKVNVYLIFTTKENFPISTMKGTFAKVGKKQHFMQNIHMHLEYE